MNAADSNALLGQTNIPLPIKSKKKLNKNRRNDFFWAYLFIAPTVIGTIIFHMWPMIQTVYLSFTEWNSFGNYTWSGLTNYKRMVHDTEVWRSLRNTMVFTVLTVPLSIILSTLVAILLNQKLRGIPIYRTLYFIPVVTMPAAIAMVWKWLYNSDFGLLNFVLGKLFNIHPSWVSDPKIAMYSIVIVAIWGSIGYNMVILISGLQGISSQYYEAASIDGAGTIVKLFRITLPLLSPTFFFLTVISLINTLQAFELIFMMIGPNSTAIESTETIVYLFFKTAFLMNDKGYATAIVLLLFIIIMTLTSIQFVLQKKWVHYE